MTYGRYLCIDGLYYTYLLVPSDGYKTQVPAGWLSLIVNAGDGIDLDMFLSRQPKERIIQRVGQQLRINRSKIKDASDTNTDFDDIDGAIRSGYFLKEGLANNEDFYYLNLLITVTAPAMPVHCFIFVDYGMQRILVLQTLKRSGGKSAASHPAASSGLEA